MPPAEDLPRSDGVNPEATVVNNIQLASLLEASWVMHRDDFCSDVVTILTEQVAQRTTATSANEVISQVVQLALRLATADWHPFDLVVKTWKVEGLLRHAVDLYLLADLTKAPIIDAQKNHEFASRLIELAAEASLQSWAAKPLAAELGAWLALAGRCNNYALAMQATCEELSEEGDAGIAECPHLTKLKVCRDFGSNVVEPHAIGHALLTDLCSGAISLDRLAITLDLQLSGLEDSKAAAVERFKYIFISRQLCTEESIGTGLQSLRYCLERNGTWQGGEVPPAVAIALMKALSCLRLIDFDPAANDQGDDAPSFGELDAVISASTARDTWQAGLVCSILQAQYAEHISACIYEDLDAFNECCKRFRQAVSKLGDEIAKGAAMSVCHAAYAKAFLQVVSHDAERMVMVTREPTSPFEENAMRVLHDELGGSMTEAALAASPVVRTLQVYLLKELRRLAQCPTLSPHLLARVPTCLVPVS